MGASVALTLLDRAALTGTETVLIEAAAAGVGGYLTRSARSHGAKRIIATAGEPAKIARAQALGADDSIDHTATDWPDRLRAILDGTTIDVAFDSIGGGFTPRLLDLMTPVHGRILGYGVLSGAPAQLSAADLFARGLTFTGCTGPEWLARVAGARETALARVLAGDIEPLIDRVLPLDQAARAHQLVEQRVTAGTILLRPNTVVA
jgi:NADPH:quinone reductase-like Zn-dependent oxidoreductase